MSGSAIRTGSATRGDHELILEGIVTTRNDSGEINVSPMGPVADRKVANLRLRPFNTSTTYQNLKRERCGVFHVTDDVALLAKCAIGRLPDAIPILDELPILAGADSSTEMLEKLTGLVLADACRWYAFEVSSLDDSAERVEIECRVLNHGRLRDFLGWNRAMHAVLEAAILATRVTILPPAEIEAQLEPLATIVAKTASQRERDAFQVLRQYITGIIATSPGPANDCSKYE